MLRGMTEILEQYCRAWNTGDLDGLFALLSEDAVYVGTTKTLRGRTAIRLMYEDGFATEAIRNLRAIVTQLRDGTAGIALYRASTPIALKRFKFADGLIIWHDLIEDPAAIARSVDV